MVDPALKNQIRNLIAKKKFSVLAIDGPCASGKSTLAEQLSKEFDCVLIHTDDFFLRPEQKTPERLAEIGGNFDRERFFEDVQRFVDYNMVSVIRIHSSGEFLSYDYFTDWIEFAKNNPEIKFYCYTKRFNFIERYLEAGGVIPENFSINVSIWKKNYDNPHNLPEFIYDDGTEPELNDVLHCPAVDEKGRKTGMTCAACKLCISAKPGQKIAVYAH